MQLNYGYIKIPTILTIQSIVEIFYMSEINHPTFSKVFLNVPQSGHYNKVWHHPYTIILYNLITCLEKFFIKILYTNSFVKKIVISYSNSNKILEILLPR